MDVEQIVLRILVAGVFGALIGLDRELTDQPAGLRTHILVSLGSALFTMVGAYGVTDSAAPVDPTRVAAQVVTGIGFLGAGAILRQGLSVRGLTTAAGLWVTAAVGVAVGLGFWEGAGVTTGVAVFSLFALKPLERKLLGRLKPGRYDFIIESDPQLSLSNLTDSVEAARGRIDSIRMEPHGEEGGHHLILRIKLAPKVRPQALAESLRAVEGVQQVDWSR